MACLPPLREKSFVRVTLNNKGPPGSSYRHALYGDHITIQRNLRPKNSKKPFQIFSGDPTDLNNLKEVPVPQARKEVDRIVSWFNLQVLMLSHSRYQIIAIACHFLLYLIVLPSQVESPIVILDQHTAANFFKNDTSKYQIFYLAMCFDRISERIAATIDI